MKELVCDLECAPVDRDPMDASFDATPHEAGSFEHFDMLGNAVLECEGMFEYHVQIDRQPIQPL